MASTRECHTCFGHPVRYVAVGCAYEARQCAAGHPERSFCEDCGKTPCDRCGEPIDCDDAASGSSVILDGERYCPACVDAVAPHVARGAIPRGGTPTDPDSLTVLGLRAEGP